MDDGFANALVLAALLGGLAGAPLRHGRGRLVAPLAGGAVAFTVGAWLLPSLAAASFAGLLGALATAVALPVGRGLPHHRYGFGRGGFGSGGYGGGFGGGSFRGGGGGFGGGGASGRW